MADNIVKMAAAPVDFVMCLALGIVDSPLISLVLFQLILAEPSSSTVQIVWLSLKRVTCFLCPGILDLKQEVLNPLAKGDV